MTIERKPRSAPNWGGNRYDKDAPPPRDRVTFRVTSKVKKELERLAQKENTTAAALVTEAVDFWLEHGFENE